MPAFAPARSSAKKFLAFATSIAMLGLACSPRAQSPTPSIQSQPSPSATPLQIDQGAAAVWQSLRKLHTRASLIAIVAHPDDEDGGMLTYESRGQGVDTTLMTLNRGEGGQNVMSGDFWDQLGLVRTEELLAADQYYGVHQYFSRVADFGFSKTIDESMKLWGHDRVLYDAVRVVRLTRPLVVTSTFTGNVSDGHGQHQVSGAIAQEVYNAAADPKVFPDQIAAGLLPWAPLKVYARVPFARVTEQGIYDYATGHWAPVKFRNYVDGTTINGAPSETVSVPVGDADAMLGRSWINIAREGLRQQKSQNDGVASAPNGPVFTPYHLYASRVSSPLPAKEDSFFAGIDTSLAGIAGYAPPNQQQPWRGRLNAINATVEQATAEFQPTDPAKIAPLLAKGLAQATALLDAIAASDLNTTAKYNMSHELRTKQQQFNQALQQALALNVLATVTNPTATANPTAKTDTLTVIPGQTLAVNLHIANQGSQSVTVTGAYLKPSSSNHWKITGEASTSGAPKAKTVDSGGSIDKNVTATVPLGAELTKPYFTRPTVEQPYYDIDDKNYLSLPTTPYPLTAEIDYTFNGVAAHIATVVQAQPLPLPAANSPATSTMEPLLIAPAISVTVSPIAGIVPLESTTFQLSVKIHSSVQAAAQGKLHLELPPRWISTPAIADFQTTPESADQTVVFEVTPTNVQPKPYTIKATAEYKNQNYTEGFQMAGYPGLRPYPYYRTSTYRATGVDVKVAPGLRIGYIMGTGDDVPRSMEDLGIHPTLLSPQDVTTADLSPYDAIVLGIRTYAERPELKTANDRLLNYVKNGGVVIVQYQTPEYDNNYGPYPLTLSSGPERVIEEDSKVAILAPRDPVLSWPNQITEGDFKDWVEERGHGFMRTWDPHYVALTEMHDAEQDPQKGGLLYARYGQGAYVYTAFAFFRQMPEGVPGAFRIFANLISIGRNPVLHSPPNAAQ